jgi:hypothetical protein
MHAVLAIPREIRKEVRRRFVARDRSRRYAAGTAETGDGEKRRRCVTR